MTSPGRWTEADYFPFSERGRLVELSDGNLEVIDPPNDFHQLILLRLAMWLQTFVSRSENPTLCSCRTPMPPESANTGA